MRQLRESFISELKDLTDAENQLLKALPKMAEAAENEELKAAFLAHEVQTREQIVRLEKVFEAFGEPPTRKKCKGMAGLVQEAQELIDEESGDASLIAAAQKAEHYEISAYGTLAAWATKLGEDDAASLLAETLAEETTTDEELTAIAETMVNDEEEEEGDADDEDDEDEGDTVAESSVGGARKQAN